MDNAAKAAEEHTRRFRGNQLDLLEMVRVGQIDYFIAGDEAVNSIFTEPGASRNLTLYVRLKFTDLQDTADGGRIMCSTVVSPIVIERFNAGIAQLNALEGKERKPGH